MGLRLLAVLLCVTGCRALLGFESPVPITDDAVVAFDVAPPDMPVDGPRTANFKLRVESLIDGRSELIVHRNEVHFQHFDFAAPGRQGGVNQSTLLDSVPWFPTWPDIPTPENRDCNGCLSSTQTVTGFVPTVPSTTTLTEIQVRVPQSIVQVPDAANDYTLIIGLSDVGAINSSIVIVEVAVEVD